MAKKRVKKRSKVRRKPQLRVKKRSKRSRKRRTMGSRKRYSMRGSGRIGPWRELGVGGLGDMRHEVEDAEESKRKGESAEMFALKRGLQTWLNMLQ